MPPPVIAKNYRGKSQSEATSMFQRDASHASIDGYRPVSQSWSAPGTSASTICGVLGILAIVGGLFLYAPLIVLGLVLIVVGALIPHPDGELSVTYQRPDRIVPKPDVMATLTSLAEARDRGLITAEEFEAKKADLLARV